MKSTTPAPDEQERERLKIEGIRPEQPKEYPLPPNLTQVPKDLLSKR